MWPCSHGKALPCILAASCQSQPSWRTGSLLPSPSPSAFWDVCPETGIRMRGPLATPTLPDFPEKMKSSPFQISHRKSPPYENRPSGQEGKDELPVGRRSLQSSLGVAHLPTPTQLPFGRWPTSVQDRPPVPTGETAVGFDTSPQRGWASLRHPDLETALMTPDPGLPSLSTHLRVSGCPWWRLHISLTSAQSSSKVVAASRLVIRMSLGQRGGSRSPWRICKSK